MRVRQLRSGEQSKQQRKHTETLTVPCPVCDGPIMVKMLMGKPKPGESAVVLSAKAEPHTCPTPERMAA